MLIDVASVSGRGSRADNEDCVASRRLPTTLAAVVADGLGGMGAGAVASRFAAEYFLNAIERRRDLGRVALEIHEGIRQQQQLQPSQATMATTLSAVAIQGTLARGVHCGDSRAFLVRGNRLVRLTDDHTEAERLFRAGAISASELLNYPRKNVLESALGMRNGPPRIDEFSTPLIAGDVLFLSTDGFHQKFGARDIIEAVRSAQSAFICCHRLEEELLRRRPDDNYSVLAAFVSG